MSSVVMNKIAFYEDELNIMRLRKQFGYHNVERDWDTVINVISDRLDECKEELQEHNKKYKKWGT